MLRRQDVGHRVVVRRIVDVSQHRPLFSDALGELLELTETDLTIATASGTLRVSLRDVHRAKRVPPARRPRAADVIALELAANEAWPAAERGRLGSWLLRATDNWTGRANSALTVGEPDRPLGAAIDAVQRWYADRGQPALITAPMPLAAPVNAALDVRGWTSRPLTLVRTAPLAALLASTDAADQPPVQLTGAPSDDWLTMVAEHKGRSPQTAVRLLTDVPDVAFAQVRDAAGDLLAVARGTLTGLDRWHELSLLQVAPGARHQGLARHLVRALAAWASRGRSTQAFLQVEQRDTAAVALSTGLGFTTHHTYLTREAPPR